MKNDRLPLNCSEYRNHINNCMKGCKKVEKHIHKCLCINCYVWLLGVK